MMTEEEDDEDGGDDFRPWDWLMLGLESYFSGFTGGLEVCHLMLSQIFTTDF